MKAREKGILIFCPFCTLYYFAGVLSNYAGVMFNFCFGLVSGFRKAR